MDPDSTLQKLIYTVKTKLRRSRDLFKKSVDTVP